MNPTNTTRFSDISIYAKSSLNSWFLTKRYYAMNFTYFSMEPHQHDEFEIMYIASGSCKVSFETINQRQETYVLKEADYIFIDSGVFHQLEVTKGHDCRILNLEVSISTSKSNTTLQKLSEKSESLQYFITERTPVFRSVDSDGSLHTLITALHRQLQSPFSEEENTVMQDLILSQLLIEIARQQLSKSKQNGNKYVIQALNYIADHYEQELKIPSIAKHCGLSVAYLQRLFKSQLDCSLIDKINSFRIEKAKILLETSTLPITDIAFTVGFNNRQHFTHTFKKYTGCSPALYHKHKGNYQILL